MHEPLKTGECLDRFHSALAISAGFVAVLHSHFALLLSFLILNVFPGTFHLEIFFFFNQVCEPI